VFGNPDFSARSGGLETLDVPSARGVTLPPFHCDCSIATAAAGRAARAAAAKAGSAASTATAAALVRR